MSSSRAQQQPQRLRLSCCGGVEPRRGAAPVGGGGGGGLEGEVHPPAHEGGGLGQREQPAGEDYVNVIILTNVTREKLLDAAVENIEQLETVRGNVSFIRVEHLDQ